MPKKSTPNSISHLKSYIADMLKNLEYRNVKTFTVYQQVPDFYVHGMPPVETGFFAEAKKQTVSGNGDEKLPFAVANVRLYSLPTLLIVTLEARPGTSPGTQKRFDSIKESLKRTNDLMHDKKCPTCERDGDEKSSNLIDILSESQLEGWISYQVLARRLENKNN